jgi:hypothetical protein
MSIKFETSIEKIPFQEARITINSTHYVKGNVMQAMFSKEAPGRPMLNVSEALVLIEHLTHFVKDQTK